MSAIPRSAWLLLALALAARVVHILVTGEYLVIGDALDFQRHAQSIAEGNGFPEAIVVDGGPSAFRAPLFPYVLGAWYWVVGDGETGARLLGALLGTVGAGMVGLFAARLFDRRVGLVALALAAFYPPLIVAGDAILSEGLFLILEVGALLAALRPRGAIAAGVLAGLAALDRSNGILLLIPLAMIVWRTESWRRAAVAVAVGVLVCVPWIVRNVSTFDAAVAITTQAGYGLAGTYNDASRTNEDPGIWLYPLYLPEFDGVFARGLDEAATERALRSKAIDYLVDHPGYAVKATALNTIRMLDLSSADYAEYLASFTGAGPTETRISRIGFWLVGLLALGALAFREVRRLPAAFWLTPLLLGLSAVAISGSGRYRVPLEPFFLVLAALTITKVWRRE